MNSILGQREYMKAVLKYFNNQVRLCLIGKLRHYNDIKNFDVLALEYIRAGI